MHKWTNLFVLGALFLMLAPSSNIMAINCAQALAIGHKSLIENGRRVQIVDSGIQILNHDVSKTLVYKTDRTFRMLELPRVVGHYGPGWQFDHYYVLGISDFGFHLYEAMGPDRMMVSAQKQPFARIEHIADYKIMNANITHAILTEYGPDNSPLLVVGAGTKVISFGFGESGFWRLGELDLEVPIKKMLLDRYVRPTSVASFGKRLFLGNVTACWFGIIFFLIIGIRSICLAYAIHGIDFVSISFWAILRDPIYLYACLDLGAIFGIISYWCFKTKQGSKRSLIFWIPGFFVFGTPAFLLYLLTYKNRPTDKSTLI